MHCKDGDGGVIGHGRRRVPDGSEPADAAAPSPTAARRPATTARRCSTPRATTTTASTTWRGRRRRSARTASVTFNVTLTKLADRYAGDRRRRPRRGLPDATLTRPRRRPQATESAGGKYSVGPIKFDAPGDWTVRFHFYENCNDAPEDSPHGHAAFFVHVPDPNAQRRTRRARRTTRQLLGAPQVSQPSSAARFCASVSWGAVGAAASRRRAPGAASARRTACMSISGQVVSGRLDS